MPTIAITGGIASGKSTFTRTLRGPSPGAEAFDTDACARRLLAEDAEASRRCATRSARAVFDAAGGDVDRAALRARSCSRDPAPRRALEAILHPRVRAAGRAGWKNGCK